MENRLRKFLMMPPAQRAVLLQALLWLPLVALLLWVTGFDSASRLSRGKLSTQTGPVPDPQAIAWLLGVAARHGLHAGNCLSRSLTLQRLLRAQGLGAELRIGARRADNGLEAHAWVEHHGRPLNDTADVAQRFPPFPHRQSALPPLV